MSNHRSGHPARNVSVCGSEDATFSNSTKGEMHLLCALRRKQGSDGDGCVVSLARAEGFRNSMQVTDGGGWTAGGCVADLPLKQKP